MVGQDIGMGENEEEPVTEKSRARTFQAEGRVRVKAGRGEQTWWLLEQGGGPLQLGEQVRSGGSEVDGVSVHLGLL